jgi:P-type E1-E2 ATPase
MTFSDSFTITIPPTLPAAMSFGVSFALDRLRRKGVYCISPPKIIMSGRIDTVCFDKTGTLTHSGMAIKNIVSENMD